MARRRSKKTPFRKRVVAKPQTVAEKILQAHCLAGECHPGQEIALRIDQTLTQDATGTMAWLQFEALGLPRVRTQLSVSYVDHNTLQTGFENADDHAFLQSMARKYGAVFSRPGNGICHQVHLERFGKPGATLLGSDSHTPTGGGLGMIAIGAGGLDVAAAMGGAAYYFSYPHIVKIHLTGRLSKNVSAKDIILEVLRRLSVKGGVGKILEYAGPGVHTLTVPERATITNMGAETGATTSVFPADEVTRAFLKYQRRENDFQRVEADPGADYSGGEIAIDLSRLEPLAARPHSPDAVVPVRELKGTRPQQIVIGSCTNSSLQDLSTVAGILAGRHVHPEVSLVINPGSQQVLKAIAQNGSLASLIASGARILEPACGACIGMGQAPCSGAISLRTFNRNFKGRSGTEDAQVYLVSPETAAAAALAGEITDPRRIQGIKKFVMPKKAEPSDSLLVKPATAGSQVKIVRGPNIKPLPQFGPLRAEEQGKVLAKFGDNITTDDIMPAGAHILPLRSNIIAISEYIFDGIDHGFSARAKAENGGYVIGGDNYGQGSSREHAALAPRYLGVRAVLAKSFARIHLANLINFGILPLTFINPEDYAKVEKGHPLTLPDLKARIVAGQKLLVKNESNGQEWEMDCILSARQREILIAGGTLNYLKQALASA
ncbi:aconitate hydratase [candidate division FCPU426 bacterium]|nr:aconitate hydratase [candidate division FCPU426 bacterium]